MIPAPPPAEIRILCLGDSYTIGEGVEAEERWPMRLAAMMRGQGLPVSAPTIVARTGWTTDELFTAIDVEQLSPTYDMVTLLIGVNDQYRGSSVDHYRERFRALLTRAVAFANGEARRVIVLSIPDWGVTPFAAGRDRRRIAREIDGFNAVNRDEASRAGARYVDVTFVSRRAAADRSLVASDGLHPAGAAYAEWAQLALPEALASLK
jgi:lysophospholipase L1-like esterase